MRRYDSSRPLVAIHIPKCAGTSVLEVFREWFGRRLYTHYYDERKGRMPGKRRLTRMFSDEYREGLCLYGHFNESRGFGLSHYYPELDQLVTIIRDPFERAVSGYFYLKEREPTFKDKSIIPATDLRSYLLETEVNIRNFFPFEITAENCEEVLDRHLLYAGITEDLQTSIDSLARTLGFPTVEVGRLNIAKRTEDVPEETYEAFREKHRVEFMVYEYAKRNYR